MPSRFRHTWIWILMKSKHSNTRLFHWVVIKGAKTIITCKDVGLSCLWMTSVDIMPLFSELTDLNHLFCIIKICQPDDYSKKDAKMLTDRTKKRNYFIWVMSSSRFHNTNYKHVNMSADCFFSNTSGFNQETQLKYWIHTEVTQKRFHSLFRCSHMVSCKKK